MKKLEFVADFINPSDPAKMSDTPAERRLRLVRLLAGFVNVVPFDPYNPNEFDDLFWTLDSGNDWKLTFLKDEPNRVNLWYRYHADGLNPHERALVSWLILRIGAFLVCADGSTAGADRWPRVQAEFDSEKLCT